MDSDVGYFELVVKVEFCFFIYLSTPNSIWFAENSFNKIAFNIRWFFYINEMSYACMFNWLVTKKLENQIYDSLL